MSKEVKLEVQVTTNSMYEFLLKHSYGTVLGKLGVLLSVLAFVYLMATYSSHSPSKIILLVIVSLLFTVINPILLYINAIKQVKLNPMFKEKLYYSLDDNGIRISQNKQENSVTWEEVSRVVEGRNVLLVYMGPARAFILPKNDMGENESLIKEMISSHLLDKQCKWKKKKEK